MGITSLEERERRWTNIRREIKENGLDGLLVPSDGHIERRDSLRYITDMSAPLMWRFVVFPSEGAPIGINMRGGWMEEMRVLPFRGGWVPESEYYAPFIAEIVRELNLEKGTIGIEGDFLPIVIYQGLLKALPEVTFQQTNLIHKLKRIKSPEEIRIVEQGVEAMDKAFEACLNIARPGITWNDITSEVCRTLFHYGAEDIGGFPMPRSTNIIQPGDSYNHYPETQAAGGFWIQLGRLVSFGEPKKELREAWELNIMAQERGEEVLRPGRTGGDVMRVTNDSLKSSPYSGAPRSSGHAIGLGVLEKPFISLDDKTVFEPGMVVSIHPVFFPPVPEFESNADMFIVTEDKPLKLSRISPELKVL